MQGPCGGRSAVVALCIVVIVMTGCRASAESTVTSTAEVPTGVAPTSAPPSTPTPTAPEVTVTSDASPTETATSTVVPDAYRSGAQVMVEDRPELIAGLRVGLIANPASQIDGRSIIDSFAVMNDVELVALFAPEHGVRGDLGAGELVPGGVDEATGVVVHSLYGTNRAPTSDQLAELDVLVYDLQDVGTRFYTFISTMGLAMQAAAAADIDFVVLDRPNPHGFTQSSGFVLESGFESFVGQYPIPAAYALTPGELAQAIVGEAWLDGLDDLRLTVVPLDGWARSDGWTGTGDTWVPPSPGLPTIASVLAYPGTVLFEAAPVSIARCTPFTFAAVGGGGIDASQLVDRFTDAALPGVDIEPITVPVCPESSDAPVDGVRWTVSDPTVFDAVAAGVHAMSAARQVSALGEGFIERPGFLDLLAGTDQLRIAIEAEVSASDIVASWQDEAADFDEAMVPYRLYPSE